VTDSFLVLRYESLTGPRTVEIAPIKQMGKIRWHVRANDTSLACAGTFFDERDLAKSAVEAALRRRYGEELAVAWQGG